jgi:ABC-type oligopeptide transport system substrate-binding subunit
MSRAGRARSLALGLCLISISCTNAPASPSPKPTATPGVARLLLLEADEPATLDPALIDDPVSLNVGSELFEGLTRLDSKSQPMPGLAERWELSDSGRTYTFHLRNARYQSGVAVGAQDAVAAWSRALNPATASPLTAFMAPLGVRYPGDSLNTVDVVDAKTLRVRLPQPDSELLTWLSLPPYWLYDPSTANGQPSGSGPYRHQRWERGKAVHLTPSDSYWGGRQGPRTVDIEIEPDPAKRLERFNSGAVDIVHGLTGPQALEFASDPKRAAQLNKVPNLRTTWLGFNTIAGGGYGPPERAAVEQAIDRARLTDLAFFGSMLAAPANDFMPPAMPGHLDRTLPAHDPALARKTLDQAGFNHPIDLYISTSSTVGRVARELADQITEATGRNVVVHPTGDFFKRLSLDQLPVFIDTWSADVPYPADLFENVIRTNAQFNNLHLEDQQVDAALDQGRAALTPADAIKAYQHADELVLQATRLIPLYSGVDPFLVRSGLRVAFAGGMIPYRWEEVR